MIVHPDKIHEFATADRFYAWLGEHHDREDEVWIKIHKLSSGLPSITPGRRFPAVRRRGRRKRRPYRGPGLSGCRSEL